MPPAAKFLWDLVPQLAGISNMTAAIVTALAACGVWLWCWRRKRIQNGQSGVENWHVVSACLLGIGVAAFIAAFFYIKSQLNTESTPSSGLKITGFSEIAPIQTPVELRLQFFGGEREPTELRRIGVLSWYTVWSHEVKARLIKDSGETEDKTVYPRVWTIFVVFERPTKINQLIVDSTTSLPPYQINFLNTIYAVMTTTGDIPAGMITIRSNDQSLAK